MPSFPSDSATIEFKIVSGVGSAQPEFTLRIYSLSQTNKI